MKNVNEEPEWEHEAKEGETPEIVQKEPEWQEEAKRGKIPEIVQKEPNDKPASLNLRWTILISVVILMIIYWLFFR